MDSGFAFMSSPMTAAVGANSCSNSSRFAATSMLSMLYAGNIAARSIETENKAGSDRIVAGIEDNRNGGGSRLGGKI